MSRARTFADLATASESNSLSKRNMIDNGNFAVNQKTSTITCAANSSVGTTLDRWEIDSSATDQLSVEISQSDDVPTELGEGYSIKYQTKTVESATVASDEIVRLIHYIEAQDCQRLGYGTSGTKTTTLSFYVKSSIAGTFSFIIYADDGADIIGSTYTINSADTWERKTITFVGNNLGTIANDTGIGLYLQWNIAAGSNFTGGDNSTWKAYAANLLASGHTQSTHMTVDESTFQLAGCQFELGEVATPFEHINFSDNLAKCQRYYSKSTPYGTAPGHGADATTNCVSIDMASNLMRTDRFFFPTSMRAAPTVTCHAQAGVGGSSTGQWAGYISSTWTHFTFSGGNVTTEGFCGSAGSTAGSQDGYAYWTHANWEANAEL